LKEEKGGGYLRKKGAAILAWKTFKEGRKFLIERERAISSCSLFLLVWRSRQKSISTLLVDERPEWRSPSKKKRPT